MLLIELGMQAKRESMAIDDRSERYDVVTSMPKSRVVEWYFGKS